MKPPKINLFNQIRLIYHTLLKIVNFANINFYNCNCSYVTISTGATESSHTYIYHDLDSC